MKTSFVFAGAVWLPDAFGGILGGLRAPICELALDPSTIVVRVFWKSYVFRSGEIAGIVHRRAMGYLELRSRTRPRNRVLFAPEVGVDVLLRALEAAGYRTYAR